MASKYEKRACEIVAGMKPWWEDVQENYVKNKKAKPSNHDGRTAEERTWDSGVFAASELIRRITKDEDLALAMHELCFWARKQRENNPDKPL